VPCAPKSKDEQTGNSILLGNESTQQVLPLRARTSRRSLLHAVGGSIKRALWGMYLTWVVCTSSGDLKWVVCTSSGYLMRVVCTSSGYLMRVVCTSSGYLKWVVCTSSGWYVPQVGTSSGDLKWVVCTSSGWYVPQVSGALVIGHGASVRRIQWVHPPAVLVHIQRGCPGLHKPAQQWKAGKAKYWRAAMPPSPHAYPAQLSRPLRACAKKKQGTAGKASTMEGPVV